MYKLGPIVLILLEKKNVYTSELDGYIRVLSNMVWTVVQNPLCLIIITRPHIIIINEEDQETIMVKLTRHAIIIDERWRPWYDKRGTTKSLMPWTMMPCTTYIRHN